MNRQPRSVASNHTTGTIVTSTARYPTSVTGTGTNPTDDHRALNATAAAATTSAATSAPSSSQHPTAYRLGLLIQTGADLTELTVGARTYAA